MGDGSSTGQSSAATVPAGVHAPPWHVTDDEFDEFSVSIVGKSGPGWYDSVAEDVSNRETADYIVRVVNERPRLVAALEELLDVGERSRSGDPSLNPETWFAARDFARIVLKEAEADA